MTGIPVRKKELLSNSLTSCITVPFLAQKKERGKRNAHPRVRPRDEFRP